MASQTTWYATLGSFPKALRMAREMGISQQRIIHRLSVLPCRFLGLADPTLRPGADASLVLLDWDTVGETNSYLEPLLPPRGIEKVWVHGILVKDGDRLIRPRQMPGRALLREAGSASP